MCRSYQLYRALGSGYSREAIIDVLRALGRALKEEAQSLVLEILFTLQVIVYGLDSHKLILFTQIFWGAVALLYSSYELYFSEAATLLSKLISRIDFADQSVQNVFRASIPNWLELFSMNSLQGILVRWSTTACVERTLLSADGESFGCGRDFPTRLTLVVAFTIDHSPL